MGHNGTNKDIKKGTEGGFDERRCRRGRQAHQSLKAYWILQYLMDNATETTPIQMIDIIYELEVRGIYSDRKSIYRDIREINIIDYLLENPEADVVDAEEAIDNDVDESVRLVKYDKSRKGYYISRRNYEEMDIRLIVESIYSARFLTEKKSKELANIVCKVISGGKASAIMHDMTLFDRKRTDNKHVLYNISTINEAISDYWNDEPKKPCKIKYDLLHHTVKETRIVTEKEKDLVASPFHLVIYDGNYYLIVYSSFWKVGPSSYLKLEKGYFKKIKVEDMDNIVCLYDEPRDGEADFSLHEISDFFNGKYSELTSAQEEVQKLFPNKRIRTPKRKIKLIVHKMLLNLIIEQFGREGAKFTEYDEENFVYEKQLYIDNEFYEFLFTHYPAVEMVGAAKDKGFHFHAYCHVNYEMLLYKKLWGDTLSYPKDVLFPKKEKHSNNGSG